MEKYSKLRSHLGLKRQEICLFVFFLLVYEKKQEVEDEF